jgi:methylmalonyl-CoA/ethylmalonyl-CoA epimerase
MTTDQVDARQVLASTLVTGIDHVGIAVADLDAAITWYHDHLGMILVHEEVNDDQGIREAMLAVRGAPSGTAQIQLMAPIDDSSTIAKFLDKRGPGIQQMAVRVSAVATRISWSQPGHR